MSGSGLKFGHSHRLGRTIGLAQVHRAHTTRGTVVDIAAPTGLHRATVSDLPFV